MKQSLGAALVTQLGGLLYLAIWALLMQHFLTSLNGQPAQSWLNQARAWWLTRRSRQRSKVFELWNRKDTAVEPTPGA